MHYTSFGIDRQLIQLVKKRLKDRAVKERIAALCQDITKEDLQNRAQIARLLTQAAMEADIPLTAQQHEAITAFVLSLELDPGNPLQLIRLWVALR